MAVTSLTSVVTAGLLIAVTVLATEEEQGGNGPCTRPCGEGTCVEDNVCDCPDGYIGTGCVIYRTNYYSVTLKATVDQPSNTFGNFQTQFADALAENLLINKGRLRILNYYANENDALHTTVEIEILAPQLSSSSMPEKYTSYGAAATFFNNVNRAEVFTKPRCCGGGLDGTEFIEFRVLQVTSEKLPISPGAIAGIVIGVVFFILCICCCYKHKDKVKANATRGAAAIKMRAARGRKYQQAGPPGGPAPMPPMGQPPGPAPTPYGQPYGGANQGFA